MHTSKIFKNMSSNGAAQLLSLLLSNRYKVTFIPQSVTLEALRMECATSLSVTYIQGIV